MSQIGRFADLKEGNPCNLCNLRNLRIGLRILGPTRVRMIPGGS